MAEICIYTNTLYITIIVVFLTAFLHVLVYLVLRYTAGITPLKKGRVFTARYGLSAYIKQALLSVKV